MVSQIIAIKINTIVIQLHLFITRPSAIPADGGCSVFVTVSIKIAIPTAIAPKTINDISVLLKMLPAGNAIEP
jgi:hypothetical protein